MFDPFDTPTDRVLRCQCYVTVPLGILSARESETRALQMGWAFIGRFALCPECTQRLLSLVALS